ncbi:Hsp33 family molecular chaperone HslO [Limibacillus halophilus]|uniref:Molecular chaperone Hsp33 n=1 Tax=Limibacillus halophilus TaxID=1579333 RepID=A0A839SX95_9PROT|nr:Hsp33 family molecular chaperone HslO [Limibacillus halophilus]MBB3066300.1 molecular chaperone Hsp33 [Limibacillus halophilus]
MSDVSTTSEAQAGSTDQIKPFMVEAAGVRGRVVRLADAVQEVLSRHAYPAPVAGVLAEMLALGAALGSLLKFEGIFTLQTKSDGPVRTMVVDMTSEGNLRGYADYDADAVAAVATDRTTLEVSDLLGEGYLAFTVDQGANTERYQGIVQLTGSKLADSVQHYFRQSEQLSTALRSAAGQSEDGGWRAGAIILQQMPAEEAKEQGLARDSEREEGWLRALTLLSTAKDQELLSEELTPNELLFRLYHEDGVRVFPGRDLAFGCRCSRDRVSQVLISVAPNDLESLKDNGRVEVICEFCRTAYHFDDDDLRVLQENADAETPRN